MSELLQLRPVTDGGVTVTTADDYVFDCNAEEAKDGNKISSVQFFNQSVRYNLIVAVGGLRLVIAPGASYSFNSNAGVYRKSTYYCNLKQFAGAAALIPLYHVVTEKYVDQ